MEKRKHIIFFIVFSIAVFLSVGVLGIQKSTVLSESAPHFNGSELKYQTGIFDIVSEIILFFMLLYGLLLLFYTPCHLRIKR